MAPDFPRAHLALGKALLQDGKAPEAVDGAAERREARAGERRGELPAWPRAGAGGPQGGRRGAAQERARARRGGGSRQNALLDIADGRAALDRGDLDEAASKFRHALSFDRNRRRRSVCSTRRSRVCDLAASAATAAPAAVMRSSGLSESDDVARVSELERYIRDAKWAEVEPLLTKYVEERPKSSWGWYALGYSLVRAEEDRRVDQSARQVAAARYQERRSAQDPRAQPHDHRPVRRRADRVRAGDPLQARLRRDPLQSRQAVFHPGQLGAGAQGIRRCPPDRSLRTSRLSMRLGFALEALGDDAGAVAKYQKAIG